MVGKLLCIKRIGVLSAGKLQGILGAVIGLVLGIIYALVVAFLSALGIASGTPLAAMGFAVALALVIFLPLLYGGLGFIGGVIGALLYNFAAAWTGGIEIETE